ncbi:MAG: short-chain dehydrogenase [Pseudomonadales bacterium]|jgi:NAD(P)-dependent dehydrogenase (short-subunit alcohol dehydrogenase family)|uniref:SDR family NAD(P)-dependent oxidoreductase n=1 Tax=unclassified Ketobacter TaxID=2639109 RepID=UPI000C50C016|nr:MULTISPECIES: SDR family NAD(P)-dependent oxidoreductase [unclassified Ketobacter]MAA60292.1 short-chain dehydrogenase [Pseudomonadales bacterium]MEC8810068.1 SDR family NAD(P)-dependent oxidoreductase [Pseudomonadota bacterium]TNC87878.1 MAG: short-chain dehydrogenase [Alcanivorax sp.]HAG95936.1 short-chain dehydrogenase [Gammaproteobacteria bacterium]MAQ24696.1 short-chain dehydrogenase [Pseudomonadales bacterium]|tara:strand:- start:20680 stop:21633 length:954 start_codon:yes stop_codon:yes gene_type:complete
MNVSNKNVLITGANSGIGYFQAQQLAAKGANIIMACRSLDKAEQAREELLQNVPDARVTILTVDVSEPDSILHCVESFKKKIGSLDVLINNAGIVTRELSRNSVGHEMHMATNYLGAFALTGLLLPCFNPDSETRIVNVGSLAHRFGKLNFDDPNWESTEYNLWRAYAQSKIATAGFTIELDRRLKQSRRKIMALGAHPGFAATDVGKKNGAAAPKNAFHQWYQDKMQEWVVGTAPDAAEKIVYAATSDTAKGGDYYGPTGLFEIKGPIGKAKLNPLAQDPVFGKRLWELSEALTGVRYLSECELNPANGHNVKAAV